MYPERESNPQRTVFKTVVFTCFTTRTFILVDRTRFELVTEACKATVLANYTNSPSGRVILFHMIFTHAFGHIVEVAGFEPTCSCFKTSEINLTPLHLVSSDNKI